MPNLSSVASQSVAVGDLGARSPEQIHGALIRQRRARHEVDEDFGACLIDADEGELFAGAETQRARFEAAAGRGSS